MPAKNSQKSPSGETLGMRKVNCSGAFWACLLWGNEALSGQAEFNDTHHPYCFRLQLDITNRRCGEPSVIPTTLQTKELGRSGMEKELGSERERERSHVHEFESTGSFQIKKSMW